MNTMTRRMIKITGRKDAPGRPILYGTTKEFLKHFGVNDLAELPKPREIDELMAEAEFEVEKRMLQGIPIGRFGQPEDVKGIALLLASDASAWITGVLFPFDGGNTAMNAGGQAGNTKFN